MDSLGQRCRLVREFANIVDKFHLSFHFFNDAQLQVRADSGTYP